MRFLKYSSNTHSLLLSHRFFSLLPEKSALYRPNSSHLYSSRNSIQGSQIVVSQSLIGSNIDSLCLLCNSFSRFVCKVAFGYPQGNF